MSKRKSSRKNNLNSLIGAFGILALLIILPLMIIISSQKQSSDKKSYAAESTDMYGIAAGDVLTNISDAELVSYFDDIQSMGVKWIRFDFSWAYVQWNSPTSY